MSVLIDINTVRPADNAAEREALRARLPGTDIHIWEEGFPEAEIEILVSAVLRPGLTARLPRLKMVQKLGAGVESFLGELPPGVRIARLHSHSQAQDMAEWALSHVMAIHRDHAFYRARQAEGVWRTGPIRVAQEQCVAVLGLGAMGARAAALFSAVGFRTLGWSRSPRDLPGVESRHGLDALDGVLAEADHVVCVLPSTPETRGLIDAGRLAAMKPGATFLNMGRGDLVDEQALMSGLGSGRPGRAVLDVVRQEPLPHGHPFWTHPQVTLTPHVSGRRQDGRWDVTAENIRRLAAGEALLNEIDVARGY